MPVLNKVDKLKITTTLNVIEQIIILYIIKIYCINLFQKTQVPKQQATAMRCEIFLVVALVLEASSLSKYIIKKTS